jgi:hypothetical protein
VLEAWHVRCFCNNPRFTRLLSFHADAAALADSEILIDKLIRRRFHHAGPSREEDHRHVQPFKCPQCGSQCEIIDEQLSIAMERAYVRWIPPRDSTVEALFLVGFYGHKIPARVAGFRETEDSEEFLAALKSP